MTRARFERFLELLPDLSAAELEAVRLAWESRDQRTRHVAKAQIRFALERPTTKREAHTALQALRDWSSSAVAITGIDSGAGAIEIGLADARRRAAGAIIEGGIGLLLEDEIDDEARDALVGAWTKTLARGGKGRSQSSS